MVTQAFKNQKEVRMMIQKKEGQRSCCTVPTLNALPPGPWRLIHTEQSCVGVNYVTCAATRWRKCIGCLKLQVSFHERATNYRSPLQKMTCKNRDKETTNKISFVRAEARVRLVVHGGRSCWWARCRWLG